MVSSYFFDSHRKIAADKCTGGDDDKYKPVVTPCPITAPDQLYISSTDSRTIMTGKEITFTLHQNKVAILLFLLKETHLRNPKGPFIKFDFSKKKETLD